MPSSPSLSTSFLVGDIGATNARFAILDESGYSRIRVLACEDWMSIEDALAYYLGEPPAIRPGAAALAVASPVAGDEVRFTNSPWFFSIEALRRRFGWERLLVVNDFTANAFSIPELAPADLMPVGGGGALAGAPVGVIGPGSGLGVGGLIPGPEGWMALASEGGHATMPAGDEREGAVIARMRRRFDHVSAERILSGPGLVNLYNTLAELDGRPAAPYTPAQITDPTTREADPLCREAVDIFCAMLGMVAGNLALTLGARGGVYIAGGIVPKLGAAFANSPFRRRFEDKGRFRPYLAAIPSFVITHSNPAFLGLGHLLKQPVRISPAKTG